MSKQVITPQGTTTDPIKESVAKAQVKNKEIDNLKSQIDILMKAVDQSKLRSALIKDKGDQLPEVRISLYGDKLIKGWKMTKDKVVAIGNNYTEDQRIEIYFFDESNPVEMTYAEFAKEITKKLVTLNKAPYVTQDKLYYEFTYEGKKYELEQSFIN